jgi:hypothetical protein
MQKERWWVLSKWNGGLEKKCVGVGGFSPFFVDEDLLVSWEFDCCCRKRRKLWNIMELVFVSGFFCIIIFLFHLTMMLHFSKNV